MTSPEWDQPRRKDLIRHLKILKLSRNATVEELKKLPSIE